MTRLRRILRVASASTLAMVVACREQAAERAVPAGSPVEDTAALRTSDIAAGGARADVAMRNPYADDANAVAEGRTLYNAMNCSGCHGGAGGGGIGPPLADADWIYGGQAENIVEAILKGRPNGMPAFGQRLPAAEAWKIAAFVATLHDPKADADRVGPPGR